MENYLGTIRNIKKHPLAERKLKNVTSEHLQSFFDLLSFGGVHPDGKERKGYSKDYIHSFSAVMQQSFRFAVFPKQEVPADYKEISFVCLRPDGCLELPTTLGTVCRKVAKALEGFEGFHFHQLRHTYTSNLLANGAAPKDVQELLGHSDVSTTMNVYAHSTRDAKRKSVRLLDKVVGND